MLGGKLVRRLGNVRLSGIIVETEAYDGENDLACHARAGLTPRTKIMYGPAGYAYVYFTYGAHWLLNCVTGDTGYPAAVLIRSIIPVEGLEIMAENRPGRPFTEWTNGPAKICQALKIGASINGISLFNPKGEVFLEEYLTIPDASVHSSPRVGIDNVPEPWLSMPWRFRASIQKD
jgi:DNA-3-methyladenine glycosylase